MILKLNKKQAYGILVISIIFEQIGTGFLEACDAFTKLVPTICLILDLLTNPIVTVIPWYPRQEKRRPMASIYVPNHAFEV